MVWKINKMIKWYGNDKPAQRCRQSPHQPRIYHRALQCCARTLSGRWRQLLSLADLAYHLQ